MNEVVITINTKFGVIIQKNAHPVVQIPYIYWDTLGDDTQNEILGRFAREAAHESGENP